MFIFLSLFISMMLLVSATSIISLNTKIAKSLHFKNGDFNQTSGVLISSKNNDIKYTLSNYKTIDEENKKVRETIEIALIRTCRTLNTLAKTNGCANPDDPATIWKFAGNIGTVGNLENIWTGTTNNAFSCVSFVNGSFGRDLMQKNIPSSKILGQGYLYDFSGINATHVDPCGYIDLVRK